MSREQTNRYIGGDRKNKKAYQVGEDGTSQEDHVSSSRRVLDAHLEFLDYEISM